MYMSRCVLASQSCSNPPLPSPLRFKVRADLMLLCPFINAAPPNVQPGTLSSGVKCSSDIGLTTLTRPNLLYSCCLLWWFGHIFERKEHFLMHLKVQTCCLSGKTLFSKGGKWFALIRNTWRPAPKQHQLRELLHIYLNTHLPIAMETNINVQEYYITTTGMMSTKFTMMSVREEVTVIASTVVANYIWLLRCRAQRDCKWSRW